VGFKLNIVDIYLFEFIELYAGGCLLCGSLPSPTETPRKRWKNDDEPDNDSGQLKIV
jgi:hypothetical protein